MAAKEKLEIVIGAAPPPFGFFAGGFPRPSTSSGRNAFGLIQEYCTRINFLWLSTAWFARSVYNKYMLSKLLTVLAVSFFIVVPIVQAQEIFTKDLKYGAKGANNNNNNR